MTNDHEHDAVGQLLGMIDRQSMEILALPAAERASHYVIVKQSCYTAMKELGRSDAQAAELAAKMEEWVRARVAMIQRSGGGSGGTA